MMPYKLLAIEQLQRGQYQPRRSFDESSLDELAQSIAEQGLIEPIVVRPIGAHQYEIIAGERRWRASMRIGLKQVPCLISDYTDIQAAAVTLIENIQRQDLNLLEEAEGYQRLIHEFHFQQEDLAKLVGKSRSHIANLLRLLTLAPPVQALLRERKLSLGHARMLVGLEVSQQITLAHTIQKHTWSVRRLEEAVRTLKLPPKTIPHKPQSPDMTRLATDLGEQVGAPVEITTEDGQSGWLKIKFYDHDTLAGLLERLQLHYDSD